MFTVSILTPNGLRAESEWDDLSDAVKSAKEQSVIKDSLGQIVGYQECNVTDEDGGEVYWTNGTNRGNPDPHEEMHLKVWRGTDNGCFDDPYRPACNAGAYNLRWTTLEADVTCPKCRALMPQR